MNNPEKVFGQKIPKLKSMGIDWVVPVCMLILFAIGVAFIYSSQTYNIDEIPLKNQFWVKQIIFFLFAGLPIYVFLSWIDYRIFLPYAHIIYLLSILLLVPLALKENFGIPVPFVDTRFNATRWIDLGFFSVQPSELAKIGTCIMAAALFARGDASGSGKSYKFWLKLGAVFFVPILLIYLQPDLGSTLVFFPMLFAMLYISKLSKRFFAAVFAVFALLASLLAADIYGYSSFLKRENLTALDSASQNAYGNSGALCLPLKDYQRNRILAFVAPDIADPRGLGVSWNQRQSLISVGTGGIFGKGLAEGTQAKLGYLPSSVAYNDFIFSVIAEESGFVGGLAVIFLLSVIVIYGCVRTAQITGDRFGQFMCIGIAAILMTHSLINVGMTMGVMPITGLPLPMLSYGGTFVLTCCILLGLVQSAYRHRKTCV